VGLKQADLKISRQRTMGDATCRCLERISPALPQGPLLFCRCGLPCLHKAGSTALPPLPRWPGSVPCPQPPTSTEMWGLRVLNKLNCAIEALSRLASQESLRSKIGGEPISKHTQLTFPGRLQLCMEHIVVTTVCHDESWQGCIFKGVSGAGH
jgi:hypothetical protein